MIAERLKDIKKGQRVYIVPSDSRCEPQYAEVYSVGPKKITLSNVNIDLKEFDSSTGRSIRWQGWSLFLSKKQYEEYDRILKLRPRIVTYFQEMVMKCTDLEKLKRLEERYKKYSDDLPF